MKSPQRFENSRSCFLFATAALLLGACHTAQDAAATSEPNREPVLLVATRGDELVTVLSAASLEEQGFIDLELGAHELAISPDGRLAVGSAYGGPGPMHQPADNRLAVFDLETRELRHTVDLGEHERPNDLAFLPDGRHVLVTSEVRGALLLVDVEANRLVETYALDDPTGHMVAYSPAAPGELGRAFVSHVVSGQVSAVDVSTGAVLARLPAAVGAEGIAATTDGTRIWCANNRSNSISVLDGQSLEAVETLACPGFPFRVEISADDSSVAVSCAMSQEVIVFDAQSTEEVARFDLSDRGKNPSPQGIAISRDGLRVAVACAGTSEVLLLNVETGEVDAVYEAGPMLDPIAIG